MSKQAAVPISIAEFKSGLAGAFDAAGAADLAATYHFVFSGREPDEVTVVVADGTLRIHDGLVGSPSLTINADSDTWLRFLAGQETPMGAIERFEGPISLYIAFGRCFPTFASDNA